jgi:hypothetical protein
MPRYCQVCSRTDAGAINVLLLEGRSARSVALELGLSEDSVQRHVHNRHVTVRRTSDPVPFRPATEPSDPLDELVAALRDHALAGNPASAHEYRLALSAQADVRHTTPPTRDLEHEPEWIELRTRMLEALEPFPAAKLAIADALEAARE